MVLLRPGDGNKPLIIVVGVWRRGRHIPARMGLKVPLVGRASSPCQSSWGEISKTGTEAWSCEANTGFRGGKETWGFVEKRLSQLAHVEVRQEVQGRSEVGFWSCEPLEEPLFISM